MKDEHTKGRLMLVDGDGFDPSYTVKDKDGTTIMDDIQYYPTAPLKEDARRLVACWNACEGVPTEAVEVFDGKYNLATIQRQLQGTMDAHGAALAELDRVRAELVAAREGEQDARATMLALDDERVKLREALRRAKAWIEGQMGEKGWPMERIQNPPAGSHLDAINAALATSGANTEGGWA